MRTRSCCNEPFFLKESPVYVSFHSTPVQSDDHELNLVEDGQSASKHRQFFTSIAWWSLVPDIRWCVWHCPCGQGGTWGHHGDTTGWPPHTDWPTIPLPLLLPVTHPVSSSQDIPITTEFVVGSNQINFFIEFIFWLFSNWKSNCYTFQPV